LRCHDAKLLPFVVDYSNLLGTDALIDSHLRPACVTATTESPRKATVNRSTSDSI
jgi:hypothetical protein